MRLSQQERICRVYRVPPWIVSDAPVPGRFSWQRWRWAWYCRAPSLIFGKMRLKG